MYHYRFELTPARGAKSSIDYCNDAVRTSLISAPAQINSRHTYAYSGKKIAIAEDDIAPQQILLSLFSREPLSNPGRALSALTRFLSTVHAPLWAGEIYGGKIFQMRVISADNEVSPEDLTDADLVHGLIDLLASGTEGDPALREALAAAKASLAPWLLPRLNKK